MTQSEIAKELGVSQTAVSLVLKNPDSPKVSRDKREMILNYLRKTNYRNTGLNAFDMKRVVHLIHGVFTHEQFYREYQYGVVEQAAKYNIDVVIKNYTGKLSARYLDNLSSGFILQGKLSDEEILIFARKRPTVLMNSYSKEFICDIVNPDNFSAIRMAVEYLYKKGHRRIAFWAMCKTLTGDLDNRHFFERLNGYKMAVTELELEEYVMLDPVKDCTVAEVGITAAARLQENRKQQNPVSAIITAGYVYGLEMIKSACHLEIKIPEELAVISIDDVPGAEYSHPPMTCIKQNRDEMGRLAVELLVQRATLPERGFKRIGCSPTLIERASA